MLPILYTAQVLSQFGFTGIVDEHETFAQVRRDQFILEIRLIDADRVTYVTSSRRSTLSKPVAETSTLGAELGAKTVVQLELFGRKSSVNHNGQLTTQITELEPLAGPVFVPVIENRAELQSRVRAAVAQMVESQQIKIQALLNEPNTPSMGK